MEEKHRVKKQFLLDESDLLNEKRGGDTNLSPLTEEPLIGQALNSKESSSVIASDQTIEEFFQPEEQQRQEGGQKPTDEHREWGSLWKVVSCRSVLCHNPETGHTVEGSRWALELASEVFLESELLLTEEVEEKEAAVFSAEEADTDNFTGRSLFSLVNYRCEWEKVEEKEVAAFSAKEAEIFVKEMVQRNVGDGDLKKVLTAESMKMAAKGRGVKKKPMTVGKKKQQSPIKTPEYFRWDEDYCGWEREQLGMKLGGSSGNHGSGKDFVVDELSRVTFWASVDGLFSCKAISKIWRVGVGFPKHIQSRKLDEGFYGKKKEQQMGKEARAGNWTATVDNIGIFMSTFISISLFKVQSGATNDPWKPPWIEE